MCLPQVFQSLRLTRLPKKLDGIAGNARFVTFLTVVVLSLLSGPRPGGERRRPAGGRGPGQGARQQQRRGPEGGPGVRQVGRQGHVGRRRRLQGQEHHLGVGEPSPAGGPLRGQAGQGRGRAREGRHHRQGLPRARLLPHHPHDVRSQGESACRQSSSFFRHSLRLFGMVF